MSDALEEHLDGHHGQDEAHEALAGDDAALAEDFVEEGGGEEDDGCDGPSEDDGEDGDIGFRLLA